MYIWLRKPIDEEELSEVSFKEPPDPDDWEKLCTPDQLSDEIENDLLNISKEFEKNSRSDLANLAVKMAMEIRKRSHKSCLLN